MIERNKLMAYLNAQLHPKLFDDYCPNGLQVEGKTEIKKIITGVSACYELLEAAIDAHADAILVHHGYFWRGENPCITGMKQRRLALLLRNNVNLIAYHLPLDAHGVWGNNKQLADLLGIKIISRANENQILPLVCEGELFSDLSGNDFAQLLEIKLKRKPLYIPGRGEKIRKIAWCSGAAQDFIQTAIDAEINAYLTGEISERTFHWAKENGIHFYAAGHHATERYGVKAVGEHLAEKFDIEHKFIDIDNPV